MSKSKFKWIDPRAWYLVGAGAVALTAEGARRLLRRRRGSAGARASETPIEIDVTDAQAKPAAKPKKAAPKAAAQPTATADTEKKAKAALESVADEAKAAKAKGTKAAKSARAEVSDAAETAEAKGEQVTRKAKAEVQETAETVKAEAKEMADNGRAALAPDDLTQIKGIGPAFAKRLAEAGYTTYADIANASPEALREATHAPAVANPEEWIDGARAKM